MNKHFLGKCTFVHWYCLALAILLWLPITILEAAPSQNLKVSGIITSATDGEPLIGVSVASERYVDRNYYRLER